MSDPPGYFVTFGGFFFAILLRLIVVPVLYEAPAKLGREKWLEKT